MSVVASLLAVHAVALHWPTWSTMASSQWALVTGASRGIGAAIAKALASRGYSLVLASRSLASLESLADELKTIGAPAVECKASDLSKKEDVNALAQHCEEAHGGVHILVNNAGLSTGGNAAEGEPDEWEKMFAVNVHAPMRLTRLLSPLMSKNGGGIIITTGSIAAMTSSGAYAATKWAMRGWSLSSYQRLRNDNIKVCLINPAFVNTDMIPQDDRLIRERMIQPEDIAKAVNFILDTSSGCVPEEITLRLTLSAYRS